MTLLLIALTAAFFVVALKWLDSAILSLPLFFPLYLFKITVFGMPITLIESFIYAAFLAFVVRASLVHYRRYKKYKIFKKFRKLFSDKHLLKPDFLRLALPLLLLILAALVSLLAMPDQLTMLDGAIFPGRRIALGILKGWILSPIIMFLLFFYVVKKNNQVLTLLNSYTISALILALWAFMQVSTQSFTTPDARASGPFENANYLALYIAPAVLYTLIRVKESIFSMTLLEKYSLFKIPLHKGKVPMEKPETFLFLVAFLLFFVSLLFTKSYGAMLGVMVAGAFYFGFEYFEYFKRKVEKKVSWKLIGVIVAASFLLALAVYQIDPGKWQAMFAFDERNSSSVRLEVYSISLTLIKENPIFGIGLGQYPAQYQIEATRILGHDPYEWNMLHPHNLYVAMWLSLGILGLVAFAWIVYLCVQSSWPHAKKFAFYKINNTPKLRVLGLSLLIIILVHGLFDTPFFKNDLALLFWLIVAVNLFPAEKKLLNG